MRHVIVYLALALLAFIIGALIAGSWDVSHWHPEGRFWLGIGLLAVIAVHRMVLYLDPIAIEKEMDKQKREREQPVAKEKSKWQLRMEEMQKEQAEKLKSLRNRN